MPQTRMKQPVDFTLCQGEHIAIMGPNGGGKTSLVDLLTGKNLLLLVISQIAYKHVEKPEDELTIGQEINAKVTELDVENKKISLSIKETLEKPAKAEAKEEEVTEAE